MHKHLVIGTAGHIDHGKTTLVKALTGTDTDRLIDEKTRGITIDLGFAFYSDQVAFVDVPGHERFIKNMAAGASAIRAALLVVAADDGVMPQTREHVAILDALGIDRGIVAITKCDGVDEEWIGLIREDISELLTSTTLAGSPIVPVDGVSGYGIDALRRKIDSLLNSLETVYNPGFFRLPVDRSFLIKGIGRVVTGSVWSGNARVGDQLRVLPGEETCRIRSLQSHEKEVKQVSMGERAALSITGIAGSPERGDLLITPGRGVSSRFLDLAVTLFSEQRILKNRARIRVHLGTAEHIGRLLIVDADHLLPGETRFARLISETPIPALCFDRGILRFYSPMETIGKLRVLDPSPPDRRRTAKGLKHRLERLAGTEDTSILNALVESRGWISHQNLLSLLPWDEERLINQLSSSSEIRPVKAESPDQKWYVSNPLWKNWQERTMNFLGEHHRLYPHENGIPRVAWENKILPGDLPGEIVTDLLGVLTEKGRIRYQQGVLSAADHDVHLKGRDDQEAERLLTILTEAGLSAPLISILSDQTGIAEKRVRWLLKALKRLGKVVLLNERIAISTDAYNEAKSTILENFSSGMELQPAEITNLLSSSRKFIIPLLEYMDSEGVTSRTKDGSRVLK